MGKLIKWIFIIFVTLFVLSMCIDDDKAGEEKSQNATAENSVDNVAQENKVTDEKPKVNSNWSYHSQTDKMRGTEIKFATIKSDNQVKFSFPYGRSGMEITVRSRHDGKDVYFSVDDAQLDCLMGCRFAMKFDNGAIKNYSMNGSNDGSADVAFLAGNFNNFVKQLKSAKTVIVEAPFYNHGTAQFEFNVEGLEW